MKKSAFQLWLEREIETFMAQPGATEEGCRAHVMELITSNPDLARQMCEDFFHDMLRTMEGRSNER
jgi:hypothetical protein